MAEDKLSQDIPPIVEGIPSEYWDRILVGNWNSVPNRYFEIYTRNKDKLDRAAELELKEKQRQFIAEQKAKRAGGQS